MDTFFELGKAKGAKEEGRLRLSSALPKIQWDSNPHCHYGYGKPLPFKYNKALLEMVELIKLKKLQKNHVMLNGLCRSSPHAPPPSPPHPFGHNTIEYLYLNLFLGSEFYSLTLHKRQVGQLRESWKPIKKFLRQRDCSKLCKITE